MKLLSFCAIALLLLSCSSKKENNPNPIDNTLKVEVSGLTDKTSITIQVKKPNGEVILDVVNQFGNKTYTSTPITERPVKLKATIKSNMNSDLEGNGVCTIKFIFNGDSRGVMGGGLSTKGNSIDISIP